MTTVVKKKRLRTVISVSRTNANRVRFCTHTLAKVLKLEGYRVADGHVYVEDQPYHLSAVTLEERPTERDKHLQLVENS